MKDSSPALMDFPPGTDINDATLRLVRRVTLIGTPQAFSFNGIELKADPLPMSRLDRLCLGAGKVRASLAARISEAAAVLASCYGEECSKRLAAYLGSDEYKARKAEQEKKDRDRLDALSGLLETAPEQFSKSDPAAWDAAVAANSDPYGSAIIRYADVWARLMEQRIHSGDTIETCAEETSHQADVEGVTGFMYGAAVAVLSQTWELGGLLRAWHNKSYGVEGGEEVVNPAVLTISIPDAAGCEVASKEIP